MSAKRITAKLPHDVCIAGRRTVGDCEQKIIEARGATAEANEAKLWLVKLIDDRINSGFFDGMVPPNVLQGRVPPGKENPKGFPHGFAVMAVACLLMETLQAFLEGVACHKKDTGQLILRFLKQNDFWQHKLTFNNEDTFLADVRNGLLHRGETRQWRIERRHSSAVDETVTPPVLGGWMFMAAIQNAKRDYLARLRGLPLTDALWETALFKLEHGILANARGNRPDEGKKWLGADNKPFRIDAYLKKSRRAAEREENERRRTAAQKTPRI